MFKKPAARRANVRKRSVAEVEDAEAEGASMSLEAMRELQRQRQRTKGVTLEAKGMLDEVDEALATGTEQAASAAAEGGLDSTFTSQTDAGEIDVNMLKYIEEQMHGGGDGEGEDGEKRRGLLNPEEAELYTTPSHLVGVVPGGAEADSTEDSANRWLAGIMEVPLGTEDKIASIEATENAKRSMMETHAKKRAFHEREEARGGHKMEVPGNYNSNFHQHRRENAMAQRAKFGGGKGGGKGGDRHGQTTGPGAKGMATDSAAFGRFRAHERRMGR